MSIEMVGFLNQRELGEAYAIADCLALPSDFAETWGLVVNEALATGLPCVVSDAVGCAPDLIRDGETGYVYPLDDDRGVGGGAGEGAPAQREGLRLGTGVPRDGQRLRLRRDDRGRRARVPLGHSRTRRTRAGLARGAGARSSPAAADGDRRRSRADDVRGARRAAPARHGGHAIVNGWENFRITPLAEAAGASWSIGPYWYPLKRRQADAARGLADGDRSDAGQPRPAARVAARPADPRAPAGLLRGAAQCAGAAVAAAARRPRDRAARHCAGAGTILSACSGAALVDPFVDRFVCNSAFTRRELIAHGIDADKSRHDSRTWRRAAAATPWRASGPRDSRAA